MKKLRLYRMHEPLKKGRKLIRIFFGLVLLTFGIISAIQKNYFYSIIFIVISAIILIRVLTDKKKLLDEIVEVETYEEVKE